MLQLGTAFRQARFISRNLPRIHPHVVVVIIHGMGTRRTEQTETDHIQLVGNEHDAPDGCAGLPRPPPNAWGANNPPPVRVD